MATSPHPARTGHVQDCELVPDFRAVPPDAHAAGVGPEPSLSSQEETRPFRDAGWIFASEGDLPEGIRSYSVVRDAAGQVRIVAPSINVKFGRDVSKEQVEAVLGAENLEVRREFGLSPNAFIVSGTDVLAKARRLNELSAIEWAQPTLIEPLGGRR